VTVPLARFYLQNCQGNGSLELLPIEIASMTSFTSYFLWPQSRTSGNGAPRC